MKYKLETRSQFVGPVGAVVTALTNTLGIEDQFLEDADVFLRNTAKNYPTRGTAEAPLTGHLSTPSIQRYIR